MYPVPLEILHYTDTLPRTPARKENDAAGSAKPPLLINRAELPVNVQVVVWNCRSLHEKKGILCDPEPPSTWNFLKTYICPGLSAVALWQQHNRCFQNLSGDFQDLQLIVCSLYCSFVHDPFPIQPTPGMIIHRLFLVQNCPIVWSQGKTFTSEQVYICLKEYGVN